MPIDDSIKKRIKPLNRHQPQSIGPVVYWLLREHRAVDNWSLLYAQHLAKKLQQSLVVVMTLRPDLHKFHGTQRMFEFMLAGLEEMAGELAKKNINLHVLVGEPVELMTTVMSENKVSAVVTDQFPLRVYKDWQTKLAATVDCPVLLVDAHNVVPVWQASDKQEYAARSIRLKINRLLVQYLIEIPQLRQHDHQLSNWQLPANQPITKDFLTDWSQVRKLVEIDHSVPVVEWLQPGAKAGLEMVQDFISTRLGEYDQKRNDPTESVLSNLSPYLHFGQVSAQRVALEVSDLDQTVNTESFLEELVVRRELSDNYCYYNLNYDRFEGFAGWAQQTLTKHSQDPREYEYTQAQLEKAQTHDPLWNAAQRQMVKTGKMHGWLRMYWAKKILEWTAKPADAQRVAIYLNDRYSLDGRDPNGYVGIAWSIGGVHDRGWSERPIFGKIRYMNFNGAKRKFNVERFVSEWGW